MRFVRSVDVIMRFENLNAYVATEKLGDMFQ